jgi:DNA-3-methyladenine glycosylase
LGKAWIKRNCARAIGFALTAPDPDKIAPMTAKTERRSPIDFSAPSADVAQALIGALLLVDGVGGRIVETEAYDPEDPASHSFSGPTERNAVMFGPPGRVYVYRSYGIHWCLNFVCCPAGHGAGVLIRALEPVAGLETMYARRGLEAPRSLCSGPGRLTQALGVTRAHNGMRLDAPPFELHPRSAPVTVVSGPRIGLTKAIDVPWRFGLAGSPFVSRPFPSQLAARQPASPVAPGPGRRR